MFKILIVQVKEPFKKTAKAAERIVLFCLNDCTLVLELIAEESVFYDT